jgi:dynein heavy chain 1, cytosolic
VCSAYCKGEVKATNALRELLGSLRRGLVPASWRGLYVSRGSGGGSGAMGLGEWMTDLLSRSQTLCSKYAGAIAALTGAGSSGTGGSCSAELMRCRFWVGGMFTPEAFVTATRQQTAQVRS